MNQARSRSVAGRAARLVPLLPLIALGVACGGSSVSQAPGGGSLEESGGSPAIDTVETGGSVADAGKAGAPTAGVGGVGGASAGAGGVSGSGASAGAGAVGQAGAGAGGSAGAGGAAGNGGAGGMGLAGSGPVCQAMPPRACSGGEITLPKSCVEPAFATAGTVLSIGLCQKMCTSMFADCSVASVQQESITIQCITRCPAHQP
jgi:hypothetical protein